MSLILTSCSLLRRGYQVYQLILISTLLLFLSKYKLDSVSAGSVQLLICTSWLVFYVRNIQLHMIKLSLLLYMLQSLFLEIRDYHFKSLSLVSRFHPLGAKVSVSYFQAVLWLLRCKLPLHRFCLHDVCAVPLPKRHVISHPCTLLCSS